MPSTARAHTQPAPGGFMRSVMRYRSVGDFDDRQERTYTQKEQDEEDEKARKRAMKNLVSSWQERLQLISVITTFFASTEAAMLVEAGDWEDIIMQISNASLLGALILHVYASVLSFLGAFLLIRYKLKEATREEMIVEGITMVNSPLGGSMIKDLGRDPIDLEPQQTIANNDAQSTMHKSVDFGTATSVPERNKRNGSYPVEPPIFSANPHIEQVGHHRLLSRTHALCVFLAAVGFILALVGILCYAWASQPRAVSIFASTCFGGAVFSMFALCT